jgi:hypothetical protein
VSYRFTGRDNERSTYEENLAAAEKLKKLNYNSYLAEFESVFPDESSPLNTSLIHIQQNEIE